MRLFLRNRLCIPVKGYNRAVIYDLTRNDYYLIDNDLYDLLNTYKVISEEKLKNNLDFLLEEDIIFEINHADESKLFPKLDLTFHNSYDLNSLVVDFFFISNNVINCDNINIQNLTIILDSEIYDFDLFRRNIQNLDVESMNLFITESGIVIKDEFLNKFAGINEFLNLYLFKSKFEGENKFKINIIELDYDFRFFTKNVFNEKFSINIEIFTEAINHNTYFNKKIFIDKNGNIKNALYTDVLTNYFNFNSLTDIIRIDSIKSLWHIIKDDILVCNKCEFRYMCIDSRVPIKDEKNSNWYFKEECRYNPFICKWEGDEDYLNLNDSGVKIENSKVVINSKKLRKINDILWS